MPAELSVLCLSEEIKYRVCLRGELAKTEAFFILKEKQKAAELKVPYWLCSVAASLINIYILYVFQARKLLRE